MMPHEDTCERDEGAQDARQRRREYLQAWRAKNRDIYRSFGKAQYEADRDKILARQYGLTPEAVRALRRARGGRCAICGGTPGEKGLQIDHDHASGVVRDLLCGKCNTGIAMFKEDTEALMAAVRYLQEHRARPRTADAWRVMVAAHPDPPQAPRAPDPLEPWLRETKSIRKSAEICGVSMRTVHNWVRDNRVEWAKTPGGSVRIYVDTLLKDAHE